MTLSEVIRQAPRSVRLDIDFLSGNYPKGLNSKVDFLVKKYALLAKHTIFNRPAKPGESRAKVDSRWIYYDSAFSLANLQSMIVFVNKILFKHLKSLKRPTIIDVGAHAGYFSIVMSELMNNPLIYAVEPLSLTFKLLQKNCIGKRNIYPVNTGFSDRKGRSRMYFEKTLLMYSSLFTQRFKWHKEPDSEIVNLERLDDFTKERKIRTVDVLKIDAEGAEELVLKGAVKTLRRTNYLIIECAMDNIRKSTFTSVMKALNNPKFNFQLIDLGNIIYSPSGEILVLDLLLKNVEF